MAVEIVGKNCIGCGACVQTCPFGALTLEDGIAVVDPDKCTECGLCVGVCPTKAIILENKKPDSKEDGIKRIQEIKGKANDEFKDYRGVWVFLEQENREIAPVGFELLGAGKKLAEELNVELAGIIFGHKIKELTQEAFDYGADKVYLIDDPVLAQYRSQPYAKGIVDLAKKYKPEVILMGATTLGRDLAGVVATKLETGLTADCTELAIEEGGRLLLQTRPAFGGNIMATIVCKNQRPQMATVRPRVMAKPEKKKGKRGVVVESSLGINEENMAVKVIDVIKGGKSAVYLDKAEIIIAGGRGLGSKENFNVIRDLADTLGGTLGASRAAVEAGWIGVEHQVGQTGHTVRPKVYIAVGISGAIQHLVGMQTSDIIVAINKDPKAPIFKVATYGIVGEALEVIPKLVEEFSKAING